MSMKVFCLSSFVIVLMIFNVIDAFANENFLDFLLKEREIEFEHRLWQNDLESTSNIASSEDYVFVRKFPDEVLGLRGPGSLAEDSSGNVYVADTYNHCIQKFTSDGVFITRWGSYGNENGQFRYPRGIAVDSMGNLYVSDSGNYRIQKFTSQGVFLGKWGTKGNGDGQFDNPSGIAMDSQGYVYVADTYNHRVQKFTLGGVFITKWGTKGNGDGQFDCPIGIAVDGIGNVYVVDSNNNRIQKFTSEGGFITKWGSYGNEDCQFSYPRGIALDSAGNVYVADTGNYRIQKFTSGGIFLRKWGTQGSEDAQFIWPYSIALDNADNVYVADTYNCRIQKFTSDGEFIAKFGTEGTGNGQFWCPMGVTVDKYGYIYVADTYNCRIQAFTSEGEFQYKWGKRGLWATQFWDPQGMGSDPQGYIYVADTYNYRIKKFVAMVLYRAWSTYKEWGLPSDVAVDNDGFLAYAVNSNIHNVECFSAFSGTFLKSWGSRGNENGQFEGPCSIAVDREGNVYVADSGNHRIQKFTWDGKFITKWGSYGYGNGQFNNPRGIAVDSEGYIYVADTYNHRIQKFTSEGVFITKWGTIGNGDNQFLFPRDIVVDSFGNVYITDSGNHQIKVYRPTKNNVYTITVKSGANGKVLPSGEVQVNHGADQTFTIIPNDGYHVADVLVDGKSVGAVTKYTFTNVTTNHTIDAIFSVDIHTVTGWNLISISVEPYDNDLYKVLESIEGCYQSVWSYDNGWKKHIIGAPSSLNDLNTIEPGKGYWIKMLSDAILKPTGKTISDTNVSLKTGWNLVGYKKEESKPVEEALSSITGKLISVWTYKDGWLRYIKNTLANNLEIMEPGRGYWINVTADCVWDINTILLAPTLGGKNVLSQHLDILLDKPEIPYLLYGNIYIDGVKATLDFKPALTVILKADGKELSRYRLGSVQRYGSFYVLEVPVTYSSETLELYVQIGDRKLDSPVATISSEAAGQLINLDLSVHSVPETSQLYQNYPNPFNPDTWIPYQLKEDANVKIKIYTSTGQLVKTLDLGYKPAGFYTTKDKAAYWDGRNELGKQLASGIYFCTIQAGDFTAIKKMIIQK